MLKLVATAALAAIVGAALTFGITTALDDDGMRGTACDGKLGWYSEDTGGAETLRAVWTPERCQEFERCTADLDTSDCPRLLNDAGTRPGVL